MESDSEASNKLASLSSLTSTDSDTESKPAELSMSGILRKMWFIGVAGSLFNTWNSMESSILAPYLFSRVQCCGIHGQLPRHYDVTLQGEIQAIQAEAAALGLEVETVVRGVWGDPVIPACSLPHFPPTSKLWSKSAHCASGSFVADSAQHLIGLNTPLQTLATLVVLPVGASISDVRGRRPVMLVYAALVALACVLYVLDTQLFPVWGNAVVLVGGMLMCPCWEPKDSVGLGAISDIVGSRGLNLVRALALQTGFIQGGWIFGFSFSFFTLGFHLVNYLAPWIVFTCVACSLVAFLHVFVPETLPEKLRGSVQMDMFNPLAKQWGALLMLRQDQFLVLLMLAGVTGYIHFVGFMTLKFTYVTAIGFSMQEAMLPSLTGTLVQLVYAFALSKFGCISTMQLYVVGHVMYIPAYALYGPLLKTIGHAAPYLADCCFGIALGSFFPATATIVSSRVGEADQAKCQAAVQWIHKLGAAIGPFIWSWGLFDATATGVAFIRPALVSLSLSMVCSAIALYMLDREDSFPPVLKAQRSESLELRRFG